MIIYLIEKEIAHHRWTVSFLRLGRMYNQAVLSLAISPKFKIGIAGLNGSHPADGQGAE